MMAEKAPYRFKTISEFHQFRGLSSPDHPLISVINAADVKVLNEAEPMRLMLDFFSIALKRNFNGKMKYGQQVYDFDEGLMTFMAPGQVFSLEKVKDGKLRHSGWMILIHPDFLYGTSLLKKMRSFEFFDYSVNEALFLSEKEEKIITEIILNIQQESKANIDKFSQSIIVAQLELMLSYAERFYQRQFITRKVSNFKVLERLEKVLADYFNNDEQIRKGLPTVTWIAEALNISPNYLSGLLKVQTGQSTQQHIHDKLIEKAKEKLSTTDLSVSEIAYELGFEHPQSFSKLFKAKTNQSPLDFRQSFN
jgi:AraC-like DNA-binding protein